MFALLVSVDYEGSELLGLYSSVEAAVAAAQRFMEANGMWGDEMEVFAMELDAEAQHGAGSIVWWYRRQYADRW